MSFLLPWAFGFLALIPAIIALYLLKIRRQPATVSTLLFWQRVLEENRRRALFQRLRHFLSLLLFLLIFLLILLALAKPVLDRHFRNGVSTILVLDRRARMQAGTGAETAFEQARALALGYARHSGELRPTAVVLTGGMDEIAAPFSTDPSELVRVLEEVEPTSAGGSIASGIGLAQQIAASRGAESRVVIFSSDPELSAHEEEGVEVITVGQSADNVAIVTFAARPLPASPETFSVLLRVQNFSDDRQRGTADIALDGRTIDVRPFDLAPGEVFSATFPLAPTIGPNDRGWLTATLSGPDALSLDDVAYAALPAPGTARILLVTRGNWFLENLLRADDSIQFDLLEPATFEPAMASAFDGVILDDVRPDNFDPVAAPGNWLLLGSAAASAPPADSPLVVETDPESPLLRMVDLTSVTFLRAAPPGLPEDGSWRLERPVIGLDAPLIATAEREGRRLAYFGFNVSDSDLPLRVAFPLLIANTLQWLTGSRPPEPVTVEAGQPLLLVEDERIAPAPGPDVEPTVRETFTPLQHGFYLMKRGEGTRWAAVNTFAPSESDLRRAVSPAEKGEVSGAAVPRLGQWPLWYLLALGALLLLLVEWLLWHRRYTE